MAPKGKGKGKPASQVTAKTTPKPDPLVPPAPFSKPPEKLQPFLDKLSKKHVYITHIDTKPRDHKRNIFLIPIVLNVLTTLFLAWRIYTVGPFYMKVFAYLMGQQTDLTIDTRVTPWRDLIEVILRRAAVFLGDFLLYVFVWPWPREFFVGQTHSNPVAWRIAVGYEEKEIAVRRSRRWDTEIGDVVGSSSPGANLFAVHARAAVATTWMYQKTAYLMMNKEWDLDWRLMIIATKMVRKRKLELEDFETAIYVHSKEFGWVTFEATDKSESGKQEMGRKKIVAFKEELVRLGKEQVFYRWIELIQYESTQPGGFTPERQAIAMKQAKELFESNGIDFDKFWEKIGGMEGLPGMDVVSS